jgi:hypothetical protein
MDTGTNGYFILNDMLGKEILSQKLINGKVHHLISFENVNSGLYHYQIVVNKNSIASGKINITK